MRKYLYLENMLKVFSGLKASSISKFFEKTKLAHTLKLVILKNLSSKHNPTYNPKSDSRKL